MEIENFIGIDNCIVKDGEFTVIALAKQYSSDEIRFKKTRIYKNLISLSLECALFLTSCLPVINKKSDIKPTDTPKSLVVEVTTLPTENAKLMKATEQPISLNSFDSMSLNLISQITTKYGIKVISPQIVACKQNIVWSSGEIEILLDTLDELPPAYIYHNSKFPHLIKLYKPVNTSGSSGGVYADSAIDLYLPSDIVWYDDPYNKQRDHLKGSIIHEFTHSYIAAHPKILEDFIYKTGWKKNYSEQWYLPIDAEMPPTSYAYNNPAEDLAETVDNAKIDPMLLSPKRINFLLAHDDFAGWDALEPYRK